MKRIIAIALMITSISSFSFGQLFKGTLKPGTQGNSVKVVIRPNAAFNAVLTNVVFVLQVPATSNPKPTAALLSNPLSAVFPNASWSILETTADGYYTYRFGAVSSGAPATPLNSNQEQEILEIVFTNGSIDIPEKVRLAHLSNGGPGTNYQFYVEAGGNDQTDYKQMFYGGTVVPASPVGSDETGYATYQYHETNGAIALPVKFLSFYALKNGDNAKLNWTVENDQDNKFFEIERSLDGKNYTMLSKVNAMGNGRTVNTYEGYDYKLSSFGKPTAFYRVKQVDQNGEIVYSQIRSLPTDRKGTPASLYPNPARSTTKLVIDLDEQVQGSIVIRDMGGKVARQLNMTFVKGVNQHNLNVADLASGEYNVTVIAGSNTYQLKLTKIN